MYSSLSILDVNKNQRFNSPISKNLFRTGTIGEGSCFLHSVLTSSSEEYRRMSEEDRMKAVKNLRKEIRDKITPDLWLSLGDGEIARVRVTEILNNLITEFYRIISSLNTNILLTGDDTTKFVYKTFLMDNVEMYQKMAYYLKLTDFEKEIIPRSMDQAKNNLVDIVDNISKNACRMMSDRILKDPQSIEKRNIPILFDSVAYLLVSIGNSTIELAYKEYLEKVGRCSAWVDQYLLGIFMDALDLDIYVLDDTTRDIYIVDKKYFKKRDSVVVIWVGGSHYEAVGEDIGGGKVKRLYKHSDPLIQNLYKRLRN